MTSEQTVIPWSTLLPRLALYLPANIFNRLRYLAKTTDSSDDEQSQQDIVQELLTTARSLDPLYRGLVQYMPRYQLDLDIIPGQPRGEMLTGTYVFADVTGFTALTELLSKEGHTRGGEVMNQIMNQLFTGLLDPLLASGGDLLIFAGDAVLAYFPQQDNHNDVLQATRAALRMQRAVVPFASLETDYGQCSLTISVGVERGLAYAGFVGTKHRMELLVSGPATFGATAAEEQGNPGEVIVGPQAREIIEDSFTLSGSIVVDDLGDDLGNYEISLPSRRAGGSAVLAFDIEEVLDALETTLQRVEYLAPFLPEDMLARFVNSTDRHRHLEAEFRPVAVQFVYIVGLEALAVQYGAEFATTVFQRYFVQALEIINRHEGVVSQIDTYAQGFILLNTFGAPRAHEGTRLYAVSAALQLGQALERVNQEFNLEVPLQHKGGITHGLIFTGEIGATYRRESVIAGPAVNRAARLMSKAEYGQVILDADIWANTRHAFVGETLPSVTLKGIEGEVVIINVRQMRRGTRLQPLARPLVDRKEERARLSSALQSLQSEKSGAMWMISGETGIGKTSLVTDLAAVAQQYGMRTLSGRCQPHGKNIPLFPWLDLLAEWLDFDKHPSVDAQRAILAQKLTALDMFAAEAALADLLGLPIKESTPQNNAEIPNNQPTSMFATLNQRTESTPASSRSGGGLAALLQQRLDETESPKSSAAPVAQDSIWQQLAEKVSGSHIILELLTKLAQQEPLLLIIEDTHWLDSESLDLLNQLSSVIKQHPLMVVLTGRNPLDNGARALPLYSLPDVAQTKIAARALGGDTLDDALAGWICKQSGGNPLYAETLCQALQQADSVLVDRDTGEVRWTRMAPTLPVSLHELLLSRLEELPLMGQDILRRAAVLGLTFNFSGLIALCQSQDTCKDELKVAFNHILEAAFLSPIDDTMFRFNCSLMQETIYETLSFALRQQWHTRIGDWLVDHQPDVSLDLQAYHYLRGTDKVKAAQYGCLAGDKARQRGAYMGSLEYYVQVLALSDAPSKMRLRAAEGRADVLTLQGDYTTAVTAYAQAADFGSTTALDKQLVLLGDAERLSEIDMASELYPWAVGARGWSLALEGQTKAALEILQNGLVIINVDHEARPALEKLAQLLSAGHSVGAYKEWLAQFALIALRA